MVGTVADPTHLSCICLPGRAGLSALQILSYALKDLSLELNYFLPQ
jgi:hypothetical protein